MVEEAKQYVIVGLGNPGKKYALTRHNMGFLVVQGFARLHGWSFKEEKQFQAIVAKGKVGEGIVHLLLPQTYMNESGRALKRYLEYYQLKNDQVIVVVDDIALDWGEIRVRNVGSAGGHNGLKSIQAHLHTLHYVRLRMGIGQDYPHDTLADYVLDGFTHEEQHQLPQYIEKGVEVLKRLLCDPVTVVMNAVNKKTQKKENKENIA